MSTSGITRVATFRGVSPRILILTTTAALAGVVFGIVQGWPAWAHAIVVVASATPVLALETAWIHRHHGWLALFYILVITQLGHVGEHVAQVFQIHVLGREGAGARGVFGQLDIEWVHFVWNTWVLIAVVLLLARFRGNRWLIAAAVLAAWHEVEHIVIMSSFLGTGQPGTPGLLATGGRIGGGVGLARPDLHFLYNIIETTPLVVAFIWQVRRTYDEWLARAFPRLSRELLIETTANAIVRRFGSGATIVEEGTEGDCVYVVTRGRADVVRGGPLRELHVTTLGPGQFFGEVAVLRAVPRTATVRAATDVEVLELSRDAFVGLLGRSAETDETVRRVLSERTTPS